MLTYILTFGNPPAKHVDTLLLQIYQRKRACRRSHHDMRPTTHLDAQTDRSYRAKSSKSKEKPSWRL